MNRDYAKIDSVFKRNVSAEVVAVTKLKGGYNSRVYKVDASNGVSYCVKLYFQSPADCRDRLSVESTAFILLRKAGFESIPKVIAVDIENKIAVYSYIEGKSQNTDIINSANLDRLAEFILSLQRADVREYFSSFANAADASFCLRDIFTDIEGRFSRFSRTKHNSFLYDQFGNFYENRLLPFYIAEKNRAIAENTAAGININMEFVRDRQVLSPADFGFHNVIYGEDDRIFFIDFEYFGWDAPEKCINDFLLHPGFELSYNKRLRFKESLCNSLAGDHSLLFRVNNTYRLFGVKWCLIILNVFSDNDLKRRMYSDCIELEKLLCERLDRAINLLNFLEDKD